VCVSLCCNQIDPRVLPHPLCASVPKENRQEIWARRDNKKMCTCSSRADVRHLTGKFRKSCALPSAGNGRRSTYTKGINLFILSSQPLAAICNCETLPLIRPTLRKSKLATNTICSAGNCNQFSDLDSIQQY
jgi:hypothetical protein